MSEDIVELLGNLTIKKKKPGLIDISVVEEIKGLHLNDISKELEESEDSVSETSSLQGDSGYEDFKCEDSKLEKDENQINHVVIKRYELIEDKVNFDDNDSETDSNSSGECSSNWNADILVDGVTNEHKEKVDDDADGSKCEKEKKELKRFEDITINSSTNDEKRIEHEKNGAPSTDILPEGYVKRGTDKEDSREALSTPCPFDFYECQIESCNIHFHDNLNAGNDGYQLIYNDSSPGMYQQQMFQPGGLMLSPGASPMSYNSPSQSSGTTYQKCSGVAMNDWVDSFEDSPSPYNVYDPNEAYPYVYTNGSTDSDIEPAGYLSCNTFPTPPRSVSPTKLYQDFRSQSLRSCMEIVDVVDKLMCAGDVPTQALAAEEVLKDLCIAVNCGLDSSLTRLDANEYDQINGLPQLTVKGGFDHATDLNDEFSNICYESHCADPIKSCWQDVQGTNTDELNVYLPPISKLDGNAVEAAIKSICDPHTLFDLESLVSAELSNNPLAVIKNDLHRDTNLTVLASRDENNRENIHEKIYALSKGLSKVEVCCDNPVKFSRCSECGNSDTNTFYTPLTLRNVQGYTALSCAVLSGYPDIIVKYLVTLLQENAEDMNREFSDVRIALYLDAKEYPFLSTLASEYGLSNW